MALIIIDGYNVTGVLRGDMQAARESFVTSLVAYNKRRGHDITVVFDGWKEGRGAERRIATGGIRVVYSALGERADAVMKRMVTPARKWIVVSSDREIQAHAWAAGSVPVSSDEFLDVLERQSPAAGDAPTGREEEDEEENAGRPLKGSPKKRSRKQKARDWALSRLREGRGFSAPR